MSKPVAPKNSPKSIKTDWGDVAQWYDQLVGESGSEYHQKVVLPGTMRLLNAQKGESVIDIACGQGVLCRLLEKTGAEVTGIDAAKELIELARQRSEGRIHFQVGDARETGFLPAGRFAAAACVLAIQNMHPLNPVFDGVARLLHPNGRLVIVMMHPAFRGARETSWGWDEQKKVQFRRVDRYLLPRKAPIVTHPGKSPDVYTWTFHKPIQDYVKSLRTAGLLIDAMEEWPSHKKSAPGPRAGAENRARDEIPMFLAIRARRVEPASTATSA